ncbi:MAG: gamma-glutamyltransferase [Gemmatimonadota bacterium]|jgi:gamma-glutamyltranspeptidase/glutathione hydrolase
MRSASAFAVAWLAGCAPAMVATTAPPDAGRRLAAEHAMVSSANPLASEAGLAMLEAGGNAVDAAVATAFAIGVVEPQMSGLGGGGSALVWMQETGRAEYLDFYAAQNIEAFRAKPDAAVTGRPRPGDLRIVAVPGNVAGLLALHEKHGRLTRAQVVAPAIRLADGGFPVNQVLAQFIEQDSAKLHRFDASSRLMWPDGNALAPGARFRNPELAASLRTVADRGRPGFYEGELARKVVGAMNAGGHPVRVSDFAGYRVRWMRPLCADYRGRAVLSAPPPQTGSQVLHTLELIEPHDPVSLGLPTRSASAFDLLASVLRVGMADNRGNDDPAWTPVPAAGRVSAGFAASRSALVGAGRVPHAIEAADAARFDDAPPAAACAAYEPYGPAPAVAAGAPSDPLNDDAGAETTHISVVDADGNAVALTQTNSSTFGSGANVSGFFLNDSGYLFSPQSLQATAPVPWRTRTSTISPTIVLEDGRVRMVVGAPGSGRIPTAIAQTMVYVLDYGMDPMAAVRMPRMFPSATNPSVQLEIGYDAEVLEQVRSMGYEPAALSSGYARIYMVVRVGDEWVGVADPRHNGEVRGR